MKVKYCFSEGRPSAAANNVNIETSFHLTGDEDRQIKFSDFARDKSDLIFQMTNLLDQELSVTSTWRHLGRSNPFRLTDERLDEIELPQSTQVLMEYLYTKDDFTIRFFYNKVKELQREDVVQILDKFINGKFISCWWPKS